MTCHASTIRPERRWPWDLAAHSLLSQLLHQVVRIPDVLRKLTVEHAALFKIYLREMRVRFERQASGLYKAQEAGVVLVALRVQ